MSTAQAIPTPTPAAQFRPGTFALRDTWFPVIHSRQVRRRPIRRAMHGQPVIFWRDGGRLRATEDMPDTPRERRRISEFTAGSGDYPLVERYGYAWVWYGDPANASPDLVPSVPHIPVEGMSRHFQGSVIFDCTYELICENLLDLTHADFLHSKLTGDALSEDDVIDVESTSETVTMIRTARGRRVPDMQKSLVDGATKQNIRIVTHAHVRSGVCILHGDYNPGMSIRMLHPANPETRRRTRTPVTYDPQHITRMGRAMFPLTAHLVGRQDNWAVRKQNDTYLLPRPNSDLSSRFDKAGLRYRKVYQALVARQQQGDTSYLDDGDPQRDIVELLGINRRA
jgi:phenylpropionate dioxygenase-like ring-hydroxylating dioxygenase large terminal subunit